MSSDNIKSQEADAEHDLRERVKAILTELEQTSLKNEVLRELKEASTKRTSPFQHPAILLILGFLLTGVVGTWLASYWQTKEQEKQQQQQARERDLREKYDVTEQVNKAIAEAYTGTRVALFLLAFDQRDDEKRQAEREAYWNQTRRTWMINSQILQQRLAIHFDDNEALTLFQDIMNDGDRIAGDLNAALEELKGKKWKILNSAEMREARQAISDGSNSMLDKSHRLLKLLIDEIHQDEMSQDP